MADFVLTLGQVGFQDFEIPPEIRAGGAQALATHKYPGGVRTIDAMGPDDAVVEWAGWFEGPDAVSRCQQLDIMRRQGQAIIASWAAYSYLVVVKSFAWSFGRYYHIGYTIALEVVQDLSYPQPAAAPDLDTQINSDATDAGADASGIQALAGAP